MEGVDRDLLYPAVKSVLDNEDGCTRGHPNLKGEFTTKTLLLPFVLATRVATVTIRHNPYEVL